MTAVIAANAEIIARAARYVRLVAAAMDDLPLAARPRFTIHYEGFGSGGTAGVDAEGARRYLKDLIQDRSHLRFNRPITSLTVRVEVADVQLVD